MASLAQWTWFWANSERWWRTSGIMLQSMWSQRVGHNSNWTTTGDLIIRSFNYKLKRAQNFDFVMLACHCLGSFANCRPWGFSVSLLILKSASKFSVFPEYRVFSSQKWIFTNKVFEPGACGVLRLSSFISHYSCHWTLIMLLFYCCRWFIIWVHNLKFMEMSYFLVLFWYCQQVPNGFGVSTGIIFYPNWFVYFSGGIFGRLKTNLAVKITLLEVLQLSFHWREKILQKHPTSQPIPFSLLYPFPEVNPIRRLLRPITTHALYFYYMYMHPLNMYTFLWLYNIYISVFILYVWFATWFSSLKVVFLDIYPCWNMKL